MQWLEPRAAGRMPIRLTPLIDVVFILLLFFMLSSRMDPIGLLELETPAPQSAGESQQDPAELHITGNGPEWNGSSIDPERARERLAAYDGQTVILSTSESTPLGEFTRWLGRIEAADLEPAWKRNRRDGGEAP